MESKFRCKCPITSALDIFGDKWSLVVIKQMLFEGRYTFKHFTQSQEAIATNILASRLKMLESFGIISKTTLPSNQKSSVYTLSEKGMSLTPVLMEMTLWSKDHIQEFNPGLNLDKDLNKVEQNKEKAFKLIIRKYKNHKKSILNQ